MYLFATHIPICVDGPRLSVPDSWYADLVLAREYFAPHFGPIRVVAPRLAAEHASGPMRALTEEHDGIALLPSFDARMPTHRYWRSGRKQLKRDLEREVARAEVVHCGVDDPFRPVQLSGLRIAHRMGRPTVLIGPDMAPREVLRGLRQRAGRLEYVRERVAHTLWERSMRKHAPLASVCMLKEGLVYDTYARYAAHPKKFCHSMHDASDVVTEEALEARLARMLSGAPLRLGYFGRLVERKGIADAIRIVAAARGQGAGVELHLHGSGAQEDPLRGLAREAGVREHVHFHGFENYGPTFLRKMADYDALLFCPTEEDTPRMVYDAFACGLPLVTTDIPFLRTRAASDDASVLFPVGDVDAGCRALLGLDRDRAALASLARRAREAGIRHTSKAWYDRRTTWTLEAVERLQRGAHRSPATV